MVTVDRDQASRAAERREVDEGGIVVHNALQLLGSIRDHPVQFAGKDGRVSRYYGFGLCELN